jgi:hypothetical protein
LNLYSVVVTCNDKKNIVNGSGNPGMAWSKVYESVIYFDLELRTFCILLVSLLGHGSGPPSWSAWTDLPNAFTDNGVDADVASRR